MGAALRRVDPETGELAACSLDMLHQGRFTREGELSTPSDQVRHGGAGICRDMGDDDPGTVGERHRRDVGRTGYRRKHS